MKKATSLLLVLLVALGITVYASPTPQTSSNRVHVQSDDFVYWSGWVLDMGSENTVNRHYVYLEVFQTPGSQNSFEAHVSKERIMHEGSGADIKEVSEYYIVRRNIIGKYYISRDGRTYQWSMELPEASSR